jgi:hypothetical protein
MHYFSAAIMRYIVMNFMAGPDSETAVTRDLKNFLCLVETGEMA